MPVTVRRTAVLCRVRAIWAVIASIGGTAVGGSDADGLAGGSTVAGKFFPYVGVGTAAKLGEPEILQALRDGFRLIDSAQADEWYNEVDAGKAIRTFIAESNGKVKRDNLWITTKMHPRHHGKTAAPTSIERSRKQLGVDTIDLVMLHYPRCWPQLCGDNHVEEGTFYDSWRALEVLVDAGVVRALGVSNFDTTELAALHDFARVKPSVVQNWMDPFHHDATLRQFCADKGIVYQAYSSLGEQWRHRARTDDFGPNPVFGHPTLSKIATQKGWSVPRVVLAWSLQRNAAVIPRSSTPEHICANAAELFGGCGDGRDSGVGSRLLTSGVLTESELRQIDRLDGALERPHTPEDL